MEKTITDFIIDNFISRGLVTVAQRDALLKESLTDNKDILDLLIDKKIVSEEELLKTEGQILNIPIIDLLDRQVGNKIFNIIPEEIAHTYKVIPFEQMGQEVKVAMLNPQDYKAIEALDFISRQKNLKFFYYLTSSRSFDHVFKQYANLTKEVSEALETADISDEEKEPLLEDETQKVYKSAPVSKTVSVIVRHAVEGGASDIHIEPMEKETRVRYRVDGVLHTSLLLPINIHPAIVARIKVLSNLKIDETRLPQDGRFKINFEGHDVEFRVSTLPLLNKEKIVMRILDTSRGTLTLDYLGFSDRNKDVVLRNLKDPHGLVLVTGPTGSGKSTTLYSMLSILNKEQVNIVTLEDPVEYNIPGVGQAQVRPEVGLTFATGLRSILRQDPDVIMVGEVRDKETAELAVHAALTGHMVLSTLHTNDAFGAIPRMIDMGIEPFLISSSLNVVAAQRLVRRICDHCKQQTTLPKLQEEDIFQELSKIPAKSMPSDINLTRPLKLSKGKGCAHCEDTGYKGRIAIIEVLEMTEQMKKIISDGQINNAALVKEELKRQGLLNMKEDGIIKALRGFTTFEEIWNATKE